MPKISIIIITKNQGHILKESFPAILAQTEKDYEIIVVDSGSGDDSYRLYKKYGASVARYTGKGKFNYARAFNIGAEKAKGTYLVRLSGDVIPADKNWLANLIAPLRDKTIGAAYSRWLNRPGNRNLFDWYIIAFSMPDHPSTFREFPNLIGASCVVRQDLWQKYRFDPKIRYCEEMDFAAKIQHAGFSVYYASRSRVYHIHKENFGQFILRSCQSFRGLLVIFWRYLTKYYRKD